MLLVGFMPLRNGQHSPSRTTLPSEAPGTWTWTGVRPGSDRGWSVPGMVRYSGVEVWRWVGLKGEMININHIQSYPYQPYM